MRNNRKIKIGTAFTVCILMLTFILSPVASASEGSIPCESSKKANAVYLYNIENDRIYFQKNADTPISPASTVKLMTALVAYESIPDLTTVFTVTDHVVNYTNMNLMSLKVGEMISAIDLLRAMICSGYNDAAVALAICACGSVDAFVKKMNEKAALLGANSTTYKDPTGLDDSARTIARDTFLVAKAFFENSELLDISNCPSVTVSATNASAERKIHNRNALISGYTGSKYLNANAMGMNVGMTDAGGYCLATAAQKNGMSYICVVMGAEYDAQTETVYSYVIANELINYVTKALGSRVILRSDSVLNSLPVSGASIKKNTVDLVPGGDVSAFLPSDYENDKDFKVFYFYEKSTLKAPVEAGEKVGMIVVSYGDDVIGVHDIVTAEAIEKDIFISVLDGIRGFILGGFFISSALCFLFLLVGYSFVLPLLSRKRKRKKYRYNNYR